MKSQNKKILWFVHDPMCSWCWGFVEVWKKIINQLPKDIEINRLVGGLAPDNNQPMPLEMREQLEATWHSVSAKTGATFNFDFWRLNTPYRSTYPACRAVICAKKQGKEEEMISAIQNAYYLQAENPSLIKTLTKCAKRIALDEKLFAEDMSAKWIEEEFAKQMYFARSIGGNHFPSHFFQLNEQIHPIPLDYNDETVFLDAIFSLVNQ